jgi:hypothetical protein
LFHKHGLKASPVSPKQEASPVAGRRLAKWKAHNNVNNNSNRPSFSPFAIMVLSPIHKKKSDEDVSETLRSFANDPLQRQLRDEKVVGLSEGLSPPPLINARSSHARSESFGASLKVRYDQYNRDIPLENDESYARMKEERRPLVLFILGYYTALKIFLYYLISLSSMLTLALSVGLTVYWYEVYLNVSISACGNTSCFASIKFIHPTS